MVLFQALQNVEELEALIAREPFVLVVFSSHHCGTCLAVERKFAAWLEGHEAVKGVFIKADEVLEVASAFGVLSSPTVQVYMDGRRVLEETGCFSVEAIEKRLERYLDYLEK